MNFTEIAKQRQSCRSYDRQRPVEREKLDAILESARIAPSACNGQPYFITVCSLSGAVRLVITLGYAKEGDPLRPKKRKDMEKLTKQIK